MSDSEQTAELARDLGFLEAFTLGVGTMIGAGIFILPSIAAAEAGTTSALSFVIGGLISLLTAVSLSELATGMPRAGGSYYYVNRSLGSFVGSIVGWGMWMGLMFATAFYMVGFGQYMTYFLGDGAPVTLLALGMTAFLVFLNYRGSKDASAIQNLIVVALMGLIVTFVTVGAFNIDVGKFEHHSWGAVAGLTATLYVSFIGFEVIATSAEEIKNPGRNLPLSMLASVLVPMVLYAAVMLVSTGILDGQVLGESKIPVADVAEQFLGSWGALLMVLGALLATISSANASILSAARVNFAMGRDKILSEWLNDIHEQFQTPYRAIALTGLLILGILVIPGIEIGFLAEVASFAFLVTYGLVHLAVLVMRRAGPSDYDPDFKIPGLLYPLVPGLGLLSCVAIILQMELLVLGVGTAVLVFGAGWYAFYARHHAAPENLIGEAIVGTGLTVPEGADERFSVVVPVANPATEELLIEMGAAAIHEQDNPEIIAVNIIQIPAQVSPAQHLRFEQTRLAQQQKLLEAVSEHSERLGVPIRTRAILARDPAQAILEVTRQEKAQRVVMGWSGQRKRREYILGSTIDRVIRNSPCEVNLVKPGSGGIGEVVALVGTGPATKIAVHEARQLANVNPNTSLTLLNVQPTGDDEEAAMETGRTRIREVAEEVGLAPREYDAKVVVGDDIEKTLIHAVMPFDTICVGATRTGTLKQAVFGSIPERIGAEVPGTVIIVDEKHRSLTITEAVVERLTPGS